MAAEPDTPIWLRVAIFCALLFAAFDSIDGR